MSRTLSAGVLTALTQPNIPILVAVQLVFDGGTVSVCNAGYNFEYAGTTFYGIGELGNIDAIQEGGNMQAYGITLSLSGIDPDMIAIALAENCQGRACNIYMAFLDASYQVISTPVLVFAGRMDTMSIEMGKTATVAITAESRLVDLERPRVSRYNHADQIAKFPGDLGMQYVPLMVERELLWGLSGIPK